VVNRREAGTTPISREASLALRALASLPDTGEAPDSLQGAVRLPVMQTLVLRAIAEARHAKRLMLAKRSDLVARPGVCSAVRGPAQASPRWDFWLRAKKHHEEAIERTAILARAARKLGYTGRFCDS
jgi:hypothetical protein